MLCWTRNKVKMKSFPLSNKYCMHQALLEPLALWGCTEVTALHNTHRYSAAPVASGREARYDSLPLFLYLVILVPPFLKPTDRVFGLFFFFLRLQSRQSFLKAVYFFSVLSKPNLTSSWDQSENSVWACRLDQAGLVGSIKEGDDRCLSLAIYNVSLPIW